LVRLRSFVLSLTLAGAACSLPATSPDAVPLASVPGLTRLPCGSAAGLEAGLRALNDYAGSGARLAAAPDDRDDSGIAIVQDAGDLVIRRNPFDLDGMSVLFFPNRIGGFDLARGPLPAAPLPELVPLATGGALAIDLPFRFPFFGREWERAFVQSDGSLTFGTPDAGAGPAGLGRFLSGPPRIAAFFAELDPGRGGGVGVELQADAVRIVWSDVPGTGQSNRNHFELLLRAEGSFEASWVSMGTREGLVGASPGNAVSVTQANLSQGQPASSPGALGERFSETEKTDLVSVARRFLTSHPDVFEQIVVYTTRPLNPVPGTLAFEVNIRNTVGGIGLPIDLDMASAWGSSGALSSVVYMDSIDQYLDVDGFEILGHEVGHRWLARASFRDATGRDSSALLGRGLTHWSFFFNSDASVLEGNQIEPIGGGRFLTVDIARGYCALDQYLMGLRPAAEVPSFFYVDEPDDFRPEQAFKFSSGPEVGVSFSGIRRDVSMAEVVAALGPRAPDARSAPKLLRQAFVLVADDTAGATPERVRALARIRARFAPWYHEATSGLGAVDSTLP
jgi:hypothetical protein